MQVAEQVIPERSRTHKVHREQTAMPFTEPWMKSRRAPPDPPQSSFRPCAPRGIEIETDMEPSLWVNGDEKQLRRVLYN